MSYRWMPIYVCGLCGKQEPADRWDDMMFGTKWLPHGWSGSGRKHGECYCAECTDAVESVRFRANGESR